MNKASEIYGAITKELVFLSLEFWKERRKGDRLKKKRVLE